MVISIPLLNGMGYTKETIRVKYKWQPPKCKGCKIFGHSNVQCLKNISVSHSNDTNEEGFMTVRRKGGKRKNVARQNSRPTNGVSLTNLKLVIIIDLN